MTETGPDEGLETAINVTGQLLGTAAHLRAFAAPGIDAIPHRVHSALVDARARLDQLESVLGQAMDLKHASGMEALRLEQIEQDAWDERAEHYRKRGLRQDFEGAQERYATFRLQTRDERTAARHARAVADLCAICEAKVRLAYRGLDNARQDLHARLRALAFESTLERT